MSDEPMIPTATAQPPLQSLRQLREASGLHIAALAAALKVPVKKLEALEAGRYEELPDLTFARALASSACRQLKIDPALVLQQIPSAQTPQLGEGSQAINAPFKGADASRSFSLAGWLTRPAVLVAVVVLLAALGLMFLPERSDTGSEALMPPNTPSENAAPIDGIGGAQVEPVMASAPAAEDAAATPAPPATAEVVQPASTAPVASTPTSDLDTGSSATALLSIVVSGDSWVEVINGRGGTVVQRMLKAGDVLDFSSAPPYSVVIGRADVAQVSVRGKVMDIMPYARNSVARFEVR